MPADPAAATRRVDWVAVALFYAIACGVSWPVFWWRDMHPQSWARWGGGWIAQSLLPAAGPASGALVAMWVRRNTHRRTVTLWGSSMPRSLAFAGVTIATPGIAGYGDDEPHLTGLLLGSVLLAYALGEELGWRGFLQDALRPLAPLPRYVLIGVMWGTWHFTSFAMGGPAAASRRLAIMYPIWILGSWGVGKAVDGTHSLVVAAMLHLVFNLLTRLAGVPRLAVLGASVVAWVILLRGWKPVAAGVVS